MMRKIFCVMSILALLASFSAFSKDLNTGPWRFELKTTYATIPFLVDLTMGKQGLEGKILNGKETIPLKDIIVKKKRLIIPIQNFEITMDLTEEDSDLLVGTLIRHNKNPKTEQSVVGKHGQSKLYPGDRASAMVDLNGKWSVTLTDEDDVKSPGVLIFKQDKNELSGSLLTPTGDYRYFTGYVSAQGFEASSFDGMYNYVITGQIDRDGKLEANILSNYRLKIAGDRNPQAALPDAYTQTKLDKLQFALPDTQGKYWSLNSPRFKNKPVIVQIFGSWCPNCMDEMNFLIPWYHANKKRGIEVVALAFERSLDHDLALIQLKKTEKMKKVPYPILVAGYTSEDKPMDKIKGLTNFISFPTTVFLNRKHEVVKVHAGFSGPSTGEYFDRWKAEFKDITNKIIKK